MLYSFCPRHVVSFCDLGLPTGHSLVWDTIPSPFYLQLSPFVKLSLSLPGRVGYSSFRSTRIVVKCWCQPFPNILSNVMARKREKSHPYCCSSDSRNWAAHVSSAQKPRAGFPQVHSCVPSDLHYHQTQGPSPRAQRWVFQCPPGGSTSHPPGASLLVLQDWVSGQPPFLSSRKPGPVISGDYLHCIYPEPSPFTRNLALVFSFGVGPPLCQPLPRALAQQTEPQYCKSQGILHSWVLPTLHTAGPTGIQMNLAYFCPYSGLGVWTDSL